MKKQQIIRILSIHLFAIAFYCNGVSQSINLFLTGQNGCNGLLEVAIFARASSFSDQDFKIGSSSIFLDFNPLVVQAINYSELEFSSVVDMNSGWLTHAISFDNECGLVNLVLQLADESLNTIYLNKQVATKIGILHFSISDPSADPDIMFRPELTSFYEAASNDGTVQIPALNFPKLTEYSCVDDCTNPPTVLNTVVQGEDCILGTLGKMGFSIADDPDREYLEISIDGGIIYDYEFADSGSKIINGLSSGFYDVWVRWMNDECPIFVGKIQIPNIGGPPVTATPMIACTGENLSTILFTIQNQSPAVRKVKISIDGGFSYLPAVRDDIGSFETANLPPGQYHIVTEWYDGSCTTDLGIVDLVIPEIPTVFLVNPIECVSLANESQLVLDVVDSPSHSTIEIILEGKNQLRFQIQDNVGHYILEGIGFGSYLVYAKWVNSDCLYFIGNFDVQNNSGNQFDYMMKTNTKSCAANPSGLIDVFIAANQIPMVSIDGGASYHGPNLGDNFFTFTNLSPGTYHVIINWNSCTEYVETVVITQAANCPTCTDGIQNGEETDIDCGGPFCAPCTGCESTEIIDVNLISGPSTFQANDWIQSSGTIAPNLSVEMNAGQYIELLPEFEVSMQSIFTAYIQDCN